MDHRFDWTGLRRAQELRGAAAHYRACGNTQFANTLALDADRVEAEEIERAASQLRHYLLETAIQKALAGKPQLARQLGLQVEKTR